MTSGFDEQLFGRKVNCERCGGSFSPSAESRFSLSPPEARTVEASSARYVPNVRIGDPPETFGRYRIIKKVGAGGMAAVYLAEDLKLPRRVALKIPFAREIEDPESDVGLKRFRREAEMLATFDHPNLCRILDLDAIPDDGRPFYAMQYIEGETLGARIKREAPIPEHEAVFIARTLAGALAEIHREGVLHRDLKPDNVMINNRGELILMDFGLARRFDAGPDITKTGQTLGTLHYMSPEQARGEGDRLTGSSDVYSLGAILYVLLSKRYPIDGSNVLSILHNIIHRAPAPISQYRPDVDPELEAVCLKALDKEIEDRYEDMNAFDKALFNWQKRRAEKARPSPASSDSVANSVGMTFAFIPSGEFSMGSDDSDADAFPDEKPKHAVKITRPFYLAIHPVTQEQYEKITGQTPSHFGGAPRNPVEQVSWLDAVNACNLLSARENLDPYYDVRDETVAIRGGTGYRLPTEAEWEYACRAGTTTRYGFADAADDLENHAWFSANGASTHPVGEKPANRFGLMDMLGNVWEWCWDRYGEDYYQLPEHLDPTGPDDGARRVLRGGSFFNGARSLRCSSRDRQEPGVRRYRHGFRVARTSA